METVRRLPLIVRISGFQKLKQNGMIQTACILLKFLNEIITTKKYQSSFHYIGYDNKEDQWLDCDGECLVVKVNNISPMNSVS